jgi:hypothetical protein
MTNTTDDILYPETPFELQPSLAILGRRGSEAHGTFIKSEDPNGVDDRDLMGVCIPPIDYTLGIKEWTHAESIKGVWDVILYDFRKFVRLLAKQNPNVLCLLWNEPEDYLHLSPAGRLLIENRNLFRARPHAYNSFVGYAYGQIRGIVPGEYKGFMGAKRKSLVDKYGFDPKRAAHAVRLLRMGIEYLSLGILKVRRTDDVGLILDIKQGKWSLDKVKAYTDSLIVQMKDVGEMGKSALPESVDIDAVNDLVVRCMREALSMQGKQ